MNPDDILRAAFRRRASMLKAVDPVVMRGRVYARACDDCGYRHRQTRYKGVTEPVDVCGRCGMVWAWEEHALPRRSFDIPKRPGSTEHRLTHLDVFLLLERLEKDPNAAPSVALYRAHIGEGRSQRELVSAAAQEWPDHAPWHAMKVCRAVRRGRKLFAAELERIGIGAGGRR